MGASCGPARRRVMPVHRYVFETFVGPIPFGYDVDHMCARWAPDPRPCRKCVNPDHLQAIAAAGSTSS
jgi:hypothetical protein